MDTNPSTSRFPAPGRGPGPATRALVEEHDVILLALAVLERAAERLEDGDDAPVADAGDLIEFIRTFADRCHHAKEEGVLFPAMVQAGAPARGGPIGVMLHEHDAGRGYARVMAEAVSAGLAGSVGQRARFVEAARSFVGLLRGHIAKENHVLFRMADELVADRAADLNTAYAGHEAGVVSREAKARIVATVERLAARYGALPSERP